MTPSPQLRSPLFQGVLPADCASISEAARVQEFTPGQLLFSEGISVERVFLLTSGMVKIVKSRHFGAELILTLGLPGDILGATGLFSAGKHSATVQAMRLTETVIWDAPVFKTLLERFPVLRQNIIRMLNQYSLELQGRLQELANEKVGSRVARQLATLLSKTGRPVTGGIEIGLSREEVAQMTATTLSTVTRLFSAWEGRGAVQARGETVTICDVPLLLAISEER